MSASPRSVCVKVIVPLARRALTKRPLTCTVVVKLPFTSPRNR